MNLNDAISGCTVDSAKRIVYLPAIQLDRTVYEALNKKLQGIGGKWNRSAKGFTFPHDPSELLESIKGGESIDIKKDYQYFPTPEKVADLMVEYIKLEWFDGAKVLEPSAGQGALVLALNRAIEGIDKVDCCEISPYNLPVLAKVPTVVVVGENFLDLPTEKLYDFIIANPPFTKNQDIAHTMKAWQHLKEGGLLVTLVSPHYEIASEKAAVEFKAFIDEHADDVIDIDAGAFKESGTMIRTKLLVLRK